MKILVLANLGLGLYKFRKELLETLAKEHEVSFCIPKDEFAEMIEALGCKFIPCTVLDRRSKNPIKDMKLIRFYRKVISDNIPDVVLTYTIKPNVYGGMVCAKKNIPYISNITGLGTTIENGGLISRLSLSLYKKGLKKASCVFFQNETNRNLFTSKGIVTGKTRLIPGSGVNLQMHSFEPYPSEDEGIRFLFVGRIMKDKGIEELLYSIRKIHAERNDVLLDVVGFCDEDYSEQLNEAVEEGAIVYHGVKKDVHPYYERCHCTVLPSYHEGLANVLLEAASTGRPVIASRIPGCRETFDENVSGLGCEPKSNESLEKAMRDFLDLPESQHEKMGILARKKMEDQFDRSIIIKAYEEEIQIASGGLK